jgi:Rps23 Pro-64 3,4-dihydroxylase Tpa1-like proline 4-hydroxylase
MNQESPEFGIHVDTVEARSFIVIHYISSDWTEEAGGQLCLYREESEFGNPTTIVNPIENRLICFFSDETNWHSIKKINTSWQRYSILSEWMVKEKKKPENIIV